jgi:outer membrane protein assembly factor BamB
MLRPLCLLLTAALLLSPPATFAEEVTHSFLACGSKTYIADATGKKIWTSPYATRDGYVLPNRKIVLAVNKSKKYPGGAAIEVTRSGEETLIWKGTQREVNSVQPTAEGTYVLTEAGPKPRLLEVDRQGKIIEEFALACQVPNHHMQTRMARKLADGTYLAPHLLDFAVKQYDAAGKVLQTFDTTVPGDPQHAIHTWPFTAIRQANGHTLVNCTHGNRVVEFDADGKIVWQLTNDDLPGPWLQDPCGAQVLPSGNVVITSYAGGRKDPDAPKLIEVNRQKQVVWTHRNGEQAGIHHFQILDTNGKQLEGLPLK